MRGRRRERDEGHPVQERESERLKRRMQDAEKLMKGCSGEVESSGSERKRDRQDAVK